jgi:hypothetical protein
VVRLVCGLVLAGAVLAGGSACSLIESRIMTPDRPNLELQREAALDYREEWPNVERIRFTREGDRPGLGASWSVNAVATFAGEDWQIIIGPGLGGEAYVGENGDHLPPDPATSPPSPTLTVIYSDGSSEVIE